MYNKYVSLEKIEELDSLIDNDDSIPNSWKNIPEIREVCRAGIFIAQELKLLGCPEALIVRIQYSAGKLSFGKDIWETHLSILEKYKNSELEIENDGTSIN